MSETEFLTTAEEAARLAADVLNDWATRFSVTEKSPANLVTEADFASQEVITKHIRSRFPDHGFLGEEGGLETVGADGCRWVIDPLDGTSNYVHRFPFYAVSIALEIDGELAVGVIYDPNRDEMFSAVRGSGARLNNGPLMPTTVETLDQALVVASLPVGAGRDDPAVERFLRILPEAQHLQRTGSAALNLCYVAAGRVEAYWSASLKPWDMAAGALIVTEAGGRVSRADGSPLRIEDSDIVASNGTALHEELRSLLL